MQVTCCVGKMNVVCSNSLYVQLPLSHAEGPVSVTALIATDAQFHCAGTGNYLVWVVDGLQADHSSISSRGVTSDTTTSSGTVQTTLTVPATSENNGTTVQYSISVSLFSTLVVSNYCSLTVLPGEH